MSYSAIFLLPNLFQPPFCCPIYFHPKIWGLQVSTLRTPRWFLWSFHVIHGVALLPRFLENVRMVGFKQSYHFQQMTERSRRKFQWKSWSFESFWIFFGFFSCWMSIFRVYCEFLIFKHLDVQKRFINSRRKALVGIGHRDFWDQPPEFVENKF